MDNTKFEKEILPLLSCALSENKNKHICQDPLILTCGHHICERCLLPEIDHKSVTCNICNQTNDENSKKIMQLESFETILNTNLDQLFELVSQKFKEALRTCKDMLSNDDKIEAFIQFAKDEILINIESIKIDLDNIYETYCNELDVKNVEWHEKIRRVCDNIKFDEKYFENELNKLEENIKQQENINKESLYYFDNQIKIIQNLIDEMDNRIPKFKLKFNEKTLHEEILNRLMFQIKDETIIFDEIENDIYKKIYKNPGEYIIDLLPDGKFLLANNERNNLLLYDNDMKLIKTVSTINTNLIEIKSICCDSNVLYMTSHKHNIIKTDSEFNQLAIYGNGHGRGSDQLNYPFGICIFNGYIFVCDTCNSRIKKFDKNLKFFSSFLCKLRPECIKNIDNVAIVTHPYALHDDNPKIIFYDLNSFAVLKEYNEHSGIIGASTTNFYEYDTPNKTFYTYDNKGELMNSIETDDFGLSKDYGFGSICIYKSKLYLKHTRHDFIIVFKEINRYNHV